MLVVCGMSYPCLPPDGVVLQTPPDNTAAFPSCSGNSSDIQLVAMFSSQDAPSHGHRGIGVGGTA